MLEDRQIYIILEMVHGVQEIYFVNFSLLNQQRCFVIRSELLSPLPSESQNSHNNVKISSIVLFFPLLH